MVRVGIIGCGSISLHRHAPEYAMNPNCKIVGYYDPKRDRAERLQERFGGKVYDNPSELIGDPGIDAVSVCTANRYHAPITIQALEAGKHVLCEKPWLHRQKTPKNDRGSAENGRFLMIAITSVLRMRMQKRRKSFSPANLGNTYLQDNVRAWGPEMWSADKEGTLVFQEDEALSAQWATWGS